MKKHLSVNEFFTAMNIRIDYTYEQCGKVGIFNLKGELTSKHEDDLKLLLMRAIHGIDRAVINLKKVKKIDLRCLNLLRKAYCTSLRLKSPIILTDVPRNYLSEIYNCEIADTAGTEWIPKYSESTA